MSKAARATRQATKPERASNLLKHRRGNGSPYSSRPRVTVHGSRVTGYGLRVTEGLRGLWGRAQVRTLTAWWCATAMPRRMEAVKSAAACCCGTPRTAEASRRNGPSRPRRACGSGTRGTCTTARWTCTTCGTVYRQDMGRWLTRDPLGYVDGMSLYGYVQTQPISAQDPSGLAAMRCDVASLYQNFRDMLETLRGMIQGLPQVNYPGGYHPQNPYQHCVWNCRMTKVHGTDAAEDQSYKKELLDVQLCRLARDFIECNVWAYLPKRMQDELVAFCQSANQPSDWWDNAQGRLCGLEVETAADCENCCQGRGITPGTREGPDSDRPYGACQLPRPWDANGPEQWWPNCPDPVQPEVPQEPRKMSCV